MKNRKITNFESTTLRLYLNDIGKIPLLSRDEESDLIQRVKKGNEEALRKLILSNLRFVVTIAKEYQNSGLPFTDLICEGNLGLYKAAKKFDPSKECKFISYAVWWVRQSILQAVSDQTRMIRLPVNRLAYIKKIKKLISGFGENVSLLSFSEIAHDLKIKPEEVIVTYQLESEYD
jgi:RNA polymerase primary sigma factor